MNEERYDRQSFAKDGDRFLVSATFDDQMLVDSSKNRITEETLAKLQDLAKECDWRARLSRCSARDQPH
ncbi:hypothetical protein ACVXG9_07145 [Escherichia coli]